MSAGQSSFSQFLTLAEAAKLLRFSRSHLSNVLHGKVQDLPHLPRIRVGRRVLLHRETLERWVREVETGPVETQSDQGAHPQIAEC